MRIFLGSGSTTVFLARGVSARELTKGLRWSRTRIVTPSPVLRAKSQKVRDRGNSLRTCTFTVEREHASLEAANLFTLDHDADIEGLSGTVTFVSEDAGREATFFLHDAAVERVDTEPTGMMTTTSYTIIGGALERT